MPMFRLVACTWLILGATTPCLAQEVAPAADTVVLRAGSQSLARADYERLVPGFDRHAGAPLTSGDIRSQQAGKEVGRLLALADEAKRRGLDQEAELAALIKVRTYTLMANALLARLVTEMKRDEAGTRAYFEQHKHEYTELEVRHILIRHRASDTANGKSKAHPRSEAAAKALGNKYLAELHKGADFSQLARKVSDDTLTRAQGGNLPAFSRGAMSSEFEAAAFALAPGEIGPLVRTAQGYHLIQLQARRPFAFERVRSTLEFARAREAIERIANSEVELNTAYFKP